MSEAMWELEQVRTRVNQDYFRSVLLANYGGTCCLTGINIPALLTASHNKPWTAATPSERLMSSSSLFSTHCTTASSCGARNWAAS